MTTYVVAGIDEQILRVSSVCDAMYRAMWYCAASRAPALGPLVSGRLSHGNLVDSNEWLTDTLPLSSESAYTTELPSSLHTVRSC